MPLHTFFLFRSLPGYGIFILAFLVPRSNTFDRFPHNSSAVSDLVADRTSVAVPDVAMRMDFRRFLLNSQTDL